MKKEANWLTSKCVSSVLAELAKKPLTPMQLRIKTGMTKNNYANIILRRLEKESIVKCLNPENRIGKMFCIDPEKARIVEEVLRKKSCEVKIRPPPKIDWQLYGRLACPYCRQLRAVLKGMTELGLAGREITASSLMEKLPGMATGDIYRALKKLIEFKLAVCIHDKPKAFSVTQDAVTLLKFDPDILI